MKQLRVAQLKQWQQQGKEFLLIDVRELFEREIFNIGGIHIPMNEIIARKEEIQTDIPVVVYCEKGIRSTIVIQRLEALGFHNLYNLAGGMNAWRKEQP